VRVASLSGAGKADTATSDAQHNHKARQLQQQTHYQGAKTHISSWEWPLFLVQGKQIQQHQILASSQVTASAAANALSRGKITYFIMRMTSSSGAGKADTATSDAQHNHKARQLQQQVHCQGQKHSYHEENCVFFWYRESRYSNTRCPA